MPQNDDTRCYYSTTPRRNFTQQEVLISGGQLVLDVPSAILPVTPHCDSWYRAVLEPTPVRERHQPQPWKSNDMINSAEEQQNVGAEMNHDEALYLLHVLSTAEENKR